MQATATAAIQQFERNVETGIPSAVVIRPEAKTTYRQGTGFRVCAHCGKNRDRHDFENGGACPSEGTHEYLFDVPLTAAIRVTAKSPDDARAMLAAVLDCANANFGAWPDGSPALGEASASGPAVLAEVDGVEVTPGYGYTYQDYMASLSAVLTAAAPGAVLIVGLELGAALLDGKPVWFDLADGIKGAADFDSSAWDDANGCWDGETHAKTWGALEKPEFSDGTRAAWMQAHPDAEFNPYMGSILLSFRTERMVGTTGATESECIDAAIAGNAAALA